MRERRKKTYIVSAVQGALVRRILVHWGLFFVMASVVLPIWGVISGFGQMTSFSNLIVSSWMETAPALVVLLLMIPIFARDTVVFSNRFAGPVYRFHRSIKDLAAGKSVQPIKLRKGDFWTDFADDFNTMLKRIEDDSKQQSDSTDDREPVLCGPGDGDEPHLV